MKKRTTKRERERKTDPNQEERSWSLVNHRNPRERRPRPSIIGKWMYQLPTHSMTASTLLKILMPPFDKDHRTNGLLQINTRKSEADSLMSRGILESLRHLHLNCSPQTDPLNKSFFKMLNLHLLYLRPLLLALLSFFPRNNNSHLRLDQLRTWGSRHIGLLLPRRSSKPRPGTVLSASGRSVNRILTP